MNSAIRRGATAAFQKAVACDKNNPAFRFNLGLAAYVERDFATATEQFQSCAILDPRNVSAWLFLGATYLQLNRLDEAYRATNNARELAPNNPDALSNLAVIAWRRGRARDAETWLNNAMRVAPNSPQVALNLARLYEIELKDKKSALEFYRRYTALEPDSQFRFAVLRSTRQLELDLNLPPSPQPTPIVPVAVATNAQPAVVPTSASTNTGTPVSTAALTSNQQPAALDALISQLKAAGRNRDAAEVALSLADHYQQQHDTNRAGTAYAQAAELDPMNSLTHFRLGELFLSQGQKAQALQSFQESVRLKPDFVAALRCAAPLAVDLGQPAVAVAAYKRIVELDPSDASALFHLGDLQERYLKNRSVAEQTYQAYLKKFPTAADASVCAITGQQVEHYQSGEPQAHCQARAKSNGADRRTATNKTAVTRGAFRACATAAIGGSPHVIGALSGRFRFAATRRLRRSRAPVRGAAPERPGFLESASGTRPDLLAASRNERQGTATLCPIPPVAPR